MQWFRSHMLPLPDYHLIVRVKLSTHKRFFSCSIAIKVYVIALLLKLFGKSLCKRVYFGRIKVVYSVETILCHKIVITDRENYRPWILPSILLHINELFIRILAFIIRLVLSLWTRKVSSFRYKCDSDFLLEAKEINGNVSFYAFNWGWEEQFTSINNPEKTSVNVTKCNRMSNIKGLCNICLLI